MPLFYDVVIRALSGGLKGDFSGALRQFQEFGHNVEHSLGGLRTLTTLGLGTHAIHGLTSGFDLATAAIQGFRGNADKALEAIERLPFGVGHAIHAFRELGEAAFDADRKAAEARGKFAEQSAKTREGALAGLPNYALPESQGFGAVLDKIAEAEAKAREDIDRRFKELDKPMNPKDWLEATHELNRQLEALPAFFTQQREKAREDFENKKQQGLMELMANIEKWKTERDKAASDLTDKVFAEDDKFREENNRKVELQNRSYQEDILRQARSELSSAPAIGTVPSIIATGQFAGFAAIRQGQTEQERVVENLKELVRLMEQIEKNTDTERNRQSPLRVYHVN